MGAVSRTYTFSAGAVIVAAQFNTNENTLYNLVNGNLDGTNLASNAAIAATQLNLATIAQTIAMSGAAINEAKGADIASATTTDIGAATGNYVHVTGTVTITGLGTVQAGTWRLVRFTGALTFTHNATSLILPTAANITTAADDHALMISLGSGNWICAGYSRKDGTPLTSVSASTMLTKSVVQHVKSQVVTSTTGTTAIPYDDSIPTSSEGDEYMTCAITPNNASNTLRIDVICHGNNSAENHFTAALYQDAGAAAIAVGSTSAVAGGNPVAVVFSYYMTAGTTSATTFKVRAGATTGATTTFNGSSGSRKFGGVLTSSIYITEYKA